MPPTPPTAPVVAMLGQQSNNKPLNGRRQTLAAAFMPQRPANNVVNWASAAPAKATTTAAEPNSSHTEKNKRARL
ncbi:hypothetical protein ACLKA6_003178 [Drosophila palustris]